MERSLLLHLSLIPGIGAVTVGKIIRTMSDSYGHAADFLYRASVADLVHAGFSEKQASLVVQGLQDKKLLEEELALLEKHAISLVTMADASYPSLLGTIYAPPPLLYVQGSVEILSKPNLIAMVGSREANRYGLTVVEQFGGALAQQKWILVSGGARGIDAEVHKVALQHVVPTISVLGSGLLRPYPHENKELFERIAATGGAVVSPFPLRHSALPGNFPARNRIIAGMARWCVVVQAAAKSGALITASYALHEGREVGVVPGSIFDPLSAGCHALLREGAVPLTNVQDLSAFVGLHEQPVMAKSVAKSEPVKSRRAVADPLLEQCAQPCSFDELLHATQLTPDVLYQKLWDLQVNGQIEQTATGLWCAKTVLIF